MPFLLQPDWVFDDYSAVTAEFLRTQGVRLLLTDLDFTLAPKSVFEPDEALRTWLRSLHDSGVTVAILSNNRNPHRVQRFCAPLGIPYVGHAGKPLRRGYRTAMDRFGAVPEQTAMLGDKLLTDCLGSRRSGVLMLMVEPKGGAVSAWQRVLHAMQEPFKRLCRRDRRGKTEKKTKKTKKTAGQHEKILAMRKKMR